MFCLLYDVITIYFSFSQTMADNREEYDFPEGYEQDSEFEDSDTEVETEISDDEFDDQGRDNFENLPDYVDIEEEPLRERAARRAAARRAGPQPAPAVDRQPEPAAEPQPEPAVDPQPEPAAEPAEDPLPGPSTEDSGFMNMGFLAQALDSSQFEDALTPKKRFSLRNAPRRNPSAKRSYAEAHHSSDEDVAGPSSRRPRTGRLFASYDPDVPDSGSDKDYVPEEDPDSPASPAPTPREQIPEETPKGRGRGRCRGRPRRTPRGDRGRGRGRLPAEEDPRAPGSPGPVDLNQDPEGPAADALPAAPEDLVGPVAAGLADPVAENQVPARRAAGLMDPGNPPYPGHRFGNPELLHQFEKMSHKRARGDLGNWSGLPVRVMRQEKVKASDNLTKWYNSPKAGVPPLVVPDRCPDVGHPNERELRDCVKMEDFFF